MVIRFFNVYLIEQRRPAFINMEPGENDVKTIGIAMLENYSVQ